MTGAKARARDALREQRLPPIAVPDNMNGTTGSRSRYPMDEERDMTLVMGAVMTEGKTHLHNKDHSGTDADHGRNEARHIKRPFDTSEVSWVPGHDDDDPPYRDWWVIESERDNE